MFEVLVTLYPTADGKTRIELDAQHDKDTDASMAYLTSAYGLMVKAAELDSGTKEQFGTLIADMLARLQKKALGFVSTTVVN